MQISYVRPEIRTVDWQAPYSLDLMGRMLMDKVSRYEANYSAIQKQFDQFGNVPIINQATKQYSQDKLNNIIKQVNGMGGVDLADINNVQQIQNVASEFSRDSRILNAVEDTRRIQSVQEKYQKDLEKNPGNIVNYTLFQQDVNEYAAKGGPDARYKGMDFMTYVDVDKSMQDMLDKLKSEGVLRQSTDPGKYIYTVTNEEVTGDRIEQIVFNHLQSNAAVMGQVRNNARYYMQQTNDTDLAELYKGYAQQRTAEKSGSVKKIGQLLQEANAMSSSPEKDAKIAELTKQLEFAQKDMDRYSSLAADPAAVANEITNNKSSVWQELYTNSLVNKYKSIYAYSKDSGFKVDDISDPYIKASTSAKKTSTEDGDEFRIEDNAVVFDVQDGTGGQDISSTALAADVESAMTEKSQLLKGLIADIKLKTGAPPADLDLYIKAQEHKIMKKEQVDPEYLDFRQKYVNANHRIENAASMLKRYEKEAQGLFNSADIQKNLPATFQINGRKVGSPLNFSRQEMVEFMQNYGKEIGKLGIMPSQEDLQKITRKIVERGSGKVAEALRAGNININSLYDLRRLHSDVFGFVDKYVESNLKQAVTTRIPMLVLNEKQKNDEAMMGQLSGLVAHDRQLVGEPAAKNVKPIKYGYDRDRLIITYQFENADKEIETATTTMLKADQTPNAFGKLLEKDPYEDMRNTLMFRGSTTPDGDIKSGSYKNTAPVIQVPYTVKNADGQLEKKFKAFYLRFTDRSRQRVFDEGGNPVSALPDTGISIDYFQFVDPDDPTGWLPMVNDEKRMLPPVKTMSQAMTAAQVYLQNLTQFKANQNTK